MNNRDSKKATLAIKYMKKNCHIIGAVESAGNKFGFTSRFLCIEFRRRTGLNYLNWVKKRVEKRKRPPAKDEVVAKYLKQNSDCKAANKKAAKKFGLSISTISVKFKRHEGITYQQWLKS